MKVYEVMNKLSEMPSGAEVKIQMTKKLDELPEFNNGLRNINFTVREVDRDGYTVFIDGWDE